MRRKLKRVRKIGVRSKADRRFVFYLLFLAVVSATFLFLSVFSIKNSEKPLEIKVIELSFSVGENVGFDLNKEALTFGKIMPGGSSIRETMIANSYDFPIKIRVNVSDNVEKFLYFEKEFVLDKGESRKVPFVVKIPLSCSSGDFFGSVRFDVFRV